MKELEANAKSLDELTAMNTQLLRQMRNGTMSIECS